MKSERRSFTSLPALFFLLSCLFLTSPIHADVIDQLSELLSKKQYAAALQLANSKLNAHEGEPSFDYLYGLAAQGNGDFHSAVYAFERVLQSSPESLDTRYALAVSYFQLGNISAARHELTQLNERTLPTQMADNVESYLNLVNRRQKSAGLHFNNWLQLGIGQDSNPNNGVEDDFVNIPLLGDVRLFDESRRISSSFYEAQAHFQLVAPRNQQSAFIINASLMHTGYEKEHAWSKSHMDLQVGYQTSIAGYQLNGAAFYRPLRLDSEDYLNYYGVTAGAHHKVWKHSELGVNLTLASLAYDQLDDLDKDERMIDLWLSFAQQRARHKIQLRWGQGRADNRRLDFNSRDYLGVGYQWRLPVGQNWQAGVTLDYLKVEHDQVHPLFTALREDDYRSAMFELIYKWSADWQLRFNLSHTDNSSSLNIYDYSRSRVALAARYEF